MPSFLHSVFMFFAGFYARNTVNGSITNIYKAPMSKSRGVKVLFCLTETNMSVLSWKDLNSAAMLDFVIGVQEVLFCGKCAVFLNNLCC